MNSPDLKALQAGEPAAWDEAFLWLWPAAFGAARATLEAYLPAQAEDVAIEAVEELVEKVEGLGSVEELKPLVASIAHNRAVSLLRKHFAARHGGGKTGSIEAQQEGGGDLPESLAEDSPVAAVEQKELAERLRKVLGELKPPRGEMLTDCFLRGLSHKDIAKKHGIAVGSVGVSLKRALESLRRAWGQDERWL